MRALIVISILAVSGSNAIADQTRLAGMHEWTKERGRTCMRAHFHAGAGKGPTKAVARKAAIRAWEEFTAFEYGWSWARFRYAASKGVAYTKTSEGWAASVEARPCIRR